MGRAGDRSSGDPTAKTYRSPSRPTALEATTRGDQHEVAETWWSGIIGAVSVWLPETRTRADCGLAGSMVRHVEVIDDCLEGAL